MNAAQPLFASPITPSREDLRRACADWLAILKQVRRSSGRSKRDVILKLSRQYTAAYQTLRDSCDDAMESASEPQRRYLEHMKHFLDPWADLAALAHLPGPIQNDLIRQATEFECLLRGLDPEQSARRQRVTRKVVTVVALLAVIALLCVLSGGPDAIIVFADSLRSRYIEFVHGLTPRTKIGFTALLVLLFGTLTLRSVRRD